MHTRGRLPTNDDDADDGGDTIQTLGRARQFIRQQDSLIAWNTRTKSWQEFDRALLGWNTGLASTFIEHEKPMLSIARQVRGRRSHTMHVVLSRHSAGFRLNRSYRSKVMYRENRSLALPSLSQLDLDSANGNSRFNARCLARIEFSLVSSARHLLACLMLGDWQFSIKRTMFWTPQQATGIN